MTELVRIMQQLFFKTRDLFKNLKKPAKHGRTQQFTFSWLKLSISLFRKEMLFVLDNWRDPVFKQTKNFFHQPQLSYVLLINSTA